MKKLPGYFIAGFLKVARLSFSVSGVGDAGGQIGVGEKRREAVFWKMGGGKMRGGGNFGKWGMVSGEWDASWEGRFFGGVECPRW